MKGGKISKFLVRDLNRKMKVIYFPKYKEKKSDKKYSTIKDELEKIEKKIKNNSLNNNLGTKISNFKRIKKFAKSKGDYRLALFVYDEYCLMIDFDIKQALGNKYEDILFNKSDFEYIQYIKENKIEEKEEIIDLNIYSKLLNLPENNKDKELCFESRNFDNFIQNYKDKKEIFRKIQSSIFETTNTHHTYKTIYKIDENILYKKFSTKDTDIIFLLTLKDDLNKIDKIIKREDLLKEAVKSYPQNIFLEDSDEWIEYIVKNSDGNIALSPEEEEILINLKDFNNKTKYPFFINGRAGSGKSTILQYLFADYIIEFLKLKQKHKNLDYEPIYLTYNSRLKEKAIDKVASIILAKSDKKLKEELNLKDKNVIFQQIEEFFKSFDEDEGANFLEELLYINKKENSLENKQKISFEEIKDYFKNLIKKKGKKYKNFTPELIWYVIRSYIKGRGFIENNKLQTLNIKEYKKLPKKLRTIKSDIVETIYKDFYKTYQKYLQENNYYDDLDLIFEVYKKNAFDKKYSIIFCDEAQDFTKIEFDLILNLNIFLEKNIKIENFNPKNIPIVFAGDPFQTINPTGFSFDYLKALVFESYKKKGINIDKLNDKELEFNYRSNDEIIKFSNLIQTLRGVIFRNRNITLQTKWLNNTGKNSILFFNNNFKKESFYQFIFPIKDKEELFNGEILEKLDIQKYDIPVDVKGLEYHSVVLYGFGDFYIKNYNNLISEIIENGFKDKESSLPYEYFLNNFYVAVTRAREKLIIIDSIKAKEKFWNQIDIDKLFEKAQEIDLNIRKEELITFKDGNSTDLSVTEKESNIYTSDKIKTDIFERYDNDKNKTLIISEIEKILKEKKLNEVYNHIISGLKAENNKYYLQAVKYLMKAAKIAEENSELVKSQIIHLKKKAFTNLYKSIDLEDETTKKYLEEYKNEFKTLGVKIKRKVELLNYFLDKKYDRALEYIKDEFSKIDLDSKMEFIILKSLKSLEDYEISDFIKDLFERDLITKKLIIEIVKEKLDTNNPKSIIRVFEIDDLKKEHKEIYCKLKLKIDPNNLDCLIQFNKRVQVLELLEKDKIDNFIDYYKQILYYISVEKKFNLLEKLDFDLIVENYIKFYNELDITIWEYLVKETLLNISENKSNDILSKLMKFFEDKTKNVQKEHLKVVALTIIEQNREIKNKILFNSLITMFSRINFSICDAIHALEYTMDTEDKENIRKILGFYQFHLKNGNKRHKSLIGSRFLKIKYELDKDGKEWFEKENIEKNWFEFIKRKIKFLRVEIDEETLKKIPLRLNKNLCQKLIELKTVDEIYKKILEEEQEKSNQKAKMIISKINKSEENTNAKDLEEVNSTKIVITEENIFDVLDEIDMFLSESAKTLSANKKRRISRDLRGILKILEDLD